MIRTLFICHAEATLRRAVFPRWLSSFSTLAGIVVLRERRGQRWKRVRFEIRRSGLLGFFDVVLFRLYYALRMAGRDGRWTSETTRRLSERYPPIPQDTPILETDSINSSEARDFIAALAPDLTLAMCKQLLKKDVFTIPRVGTFVMHPGICPEYRNAHGCFWALANDEPDKVGMTLLQIDEGIDTGPVFGYYTYAFDELSESHNVIQYRVILDNLDLLASELTDIVSGACLPIDTTGRPSLTWGQPRLSSYLRWQWRARRRAKQ